MERVRCVLMTSAGHWASWVGKVGLGQNQECCPCLAATRGSRQAAAGAGATPRGTEGLSCCSCPVLGSLLPPSIWPATSTMAPLGRPEPCRPALTTYLERTVL